MDEVMKPKELIQSSWVEAQYEVHKKPIFIFI